MKVEGSKRILAYGISYNGIINYKLIKYFEKIENISCSIDLEILFLIVQKKAGKIFLFKCNEKVEEDINISIYFDNNKEFKEYLEFEISVNIHNYTDIKLIYDFNKFEFISMFDKNFIYLNKYRDYELKLVHMDYEELVEEYKKKLGKVPNYIFYKKYKIRNDLLHEFSYKILFNNLYEKIRN